MRVITIGFVVLVLAPTCWALVNCTSSDSGGTMIEVSNSSGMITTPTSSSKLECLWILHSPRADYTVKVELLNSSFGWTLGCVQEYIAAYDGNTTSSRLIGKWCRNDTPTFYSTGQYMTVLFKRGEDNKVGGASFLHAEVSAYAECRNFEQGGITLQAHDVTNTLHWFREEALVDSAYNCWWVLKSHSHQGVVEASAVDIKMSKTSDCSAANIAVYDGDRESSPLLAKWCTDSTGTVQSTGAYLAFRLVTDPTRDPLEFSIQYRQVYATKGHSDASVGAIVAGTFAGIVLISCLAAVLCCVFCCKKPFHKRSSLDSSGTPHIQTPLFHRYHQPGQANTGQSNQSYESSGVHPTAPCPHTPLPSYITEPSSVYPYDAPPPYPTTKFLLSSMSTP